MKNNNTKETQASKLRNALGPFWTLTEILNGDLIIPGEEELFFKQFKFHILNCAKQCRDSKVKILEVIEGMEEQIKLL